MRPQGRVRILVVDDAPELRMLVLAMLRDVDGIEVAECATGEEAVALVASHPVELVIMDEQLPGIDGAAATREILHLAPRVDVVAFTASPEAERGMLDAGATMHFSKLEFAAMVEYVVHRVAQLRSAR